MDILLIDFRWIFRLDEDAGSYIEIIQIHITDNDSVHR